MKLTVVFTDEQRAELEPWLLVPVDQANDLDYITALARLHAAAAAVPTEPTGGQE